MKSIRLLQFVLVVLFSIGNLSAQISVVKSEGGNNLPKSYPIIGSHLLEKETQIVRDYIRQNPGMIKEMRQAKPQSWGFNVGDTHSWYSVNFQTSAYYSVSSTCRAVGTHCYIFVENTMWNTYVTQSVVDSVKNAFDLRTPANPSKGVYQSDVDAFGNPPDVDSDPKIIILILDIQDGYSGSGAYVAGYFSPWNESNLPNSNRAEIYFLDAFPLNLQTSAGLTDGLSTTAHEFQHMIHWNSDPNEIRFVNEGCSLIAEVNCGYPIFDQSGYVTETNHYLLDWRSNSDPNVLRDYSRAARFTTYIRDQVGMGVFKEIVSSPMTGIVGIDDGLSTYGSSLTFDSLFRNWLIANILDDTTVARAYGYVYPNLMKAEGTNYWIPNVSLTTDTVQNLGARYLRFRYGTNLKATFITSDPKVLIKAVETGPISKRVLDVTSGVQFSEPEFGTTYTEVDFVVMNTDQNFPYSYTYQSSGNNGGPLELKWDETEPTGYYKLAPGDTACVTFDAFPGARLDSVRVAMRRIHTITGGVWNFTGTSRPTPLGNKLAGPFSVSTTLNPPYPYPVPWPNWGKANLISQNIIVNQPFAVAFIVGADSVAPMITDYADTTAYHSFTYIKEDAAPGWYYIGGGGKVELWLIRAYVSFPSNGAREVVELLPTAFNLMQNYPNPFNPSTKIEYTLPTAARVKLEIFNTLGQKVATLVDGVETSGLKSVEWKSDINGKYLTSGLYFYRLVASALDGQKELFRQVNKMILLK